MMVVGMPDDEAVRLLVHCWVSRLLRRFVGGWTVSLAGGTGARSGEPRRPANPDSAYAKRWWSSAPGRWRSWVGTVTADVCLRLADSGRRRVLGVGTEYERHEVEEDHGSWRGLSGSRRRMEGPVSVIR